MRQECFPPQEKTQESLFVSYFPFIEMSSNLLLLKKCVINKVVKPATIKPPTGEEKEVNPIY